MEVDRVAVGGGGKLLLLRRNIIADDAATNAEGGGALTTIGTIILLYLRTHKYTPPLPREFEWEVVTNGVRSRVASRRVMRSISQTR